MEQTSNKRQRNNVVINYKMPRRQGKTGDVSFFVFTFNSDDTVSGKYNFFNDNWLLLTVNYISPVLDLI